MDEGYWGMGKGVGDVGDRELGVVGEESGAGSGDVGGVSAAADGRSGLAKYLERIAFPFLPSSSARGVHHAIASRISLCFVPPFRCSFCVLRSFASSSSRARSLFLLAVCVFPAFILPLTARLTVSSSTKSTTPSAILSPSAMQSANCARLMCWIAGLFTLAVQGTFASPRI